MNGTTGQARRQKTTQALALLLASLSFQAGAAAITVNSLADTDADDGECTLREAIIAANTSNPSGSMPGECVGGELDPVVDRIEFDAGLVGTIGLSSGLPQINDPIEIVGPGPADLIIDGSAIPTQALRVIDDALIEGLAIINTSSASSGGAINADQPLTLRSVIIENNQATDGGGVYTTAHLTVEDSVFRGNTASDFDGGAIRLANAAQTLIVRDSLFENNETALNARSGGAIHVGGSDHVTEISGSTFVGNAALGEDRDGGALRVEGQSLTIVNSTFSGNTAADQGGAIWAAAATNRLINVTATGNRADRDSDGNGDGGGLFGLNDVVVINSLLAGNFDSGLEAPDCSGTLIDSRYNLVGNGNGCSGVSDGVDGNQVGTFSMPIDPMLEALADNGGETPTHALLAASPAIDAGDPAGCEDALGDPLTVDQRRKPRPADGDEDGTAICDIGAFELAGDSIFLDRFED